MAHFRKDRCHGWRGDELPAGGGRQAGHEEGLNVSLA
jgi:hypothetical protein